MTDKIAAANKALVRRFYKEVYVDWNKALVDEVVSPRFTSHDWPEDGARGPLAFRDYYAAIRSAVPDARYEVDDLIAERERRQAVRQIRRFVPRDDDGAQFLPWLDRRQALTGALCRCHE